MITIKNLTKKYKHVTALNNVNLDVKDGELYGLLGVNGAGKSTLIKILCGLTKKTSGEVIVNGYDLDKDAVKIKEIIDVSPQEISVAQNLTVQENLKFFASVYGKKDSPLIEEIISTFKLDTVLNQRTKTLSGGYKRRLSVAVSLISEPQILFLDEPTLGLDVLARRELWSIINKLKGKMTIILTSHYLDEIEQLCDRVGVMSNGNVLAVGTTQELMELTSTATFENAFVSLVEKAYE